MPGNCTPPLHVSGPRALIRSEAFGARGAVSPASRVGRLPAWKLTEPGYARDDERLFAGRVALIGNTHQQATDRWRTPEGVQPGVELVADTIRFASRQLAMSQDKRFWAVSALLLAFCVVRILFRPLLAGSVTIAISLWFAWHYLGRGSYGAVDELETASIAVILIALAEDFTGFVRNFRRHGFLVAILHSEEEK